MSDQPVTTDRGRLRQLEAHVAVLLTVLVALGSLGLPAEGSVAREPSAADTGVVVTEERIPVPPSSLAQKPSSQLHADAMWIWERGHRAFFLKNSGRAELPRSKANSQFAPHDSELVAVDMHTGLEAGRITLSPGAQNVFQQSVAVDEDGGRLFVPYYDPALESTYKAEVNGTGLNATRGELCVSPMFYHVCVNGFAVIDAQTLEVQRRIPLRNLGVDGLPPTSLTLWALSFSPARGPDDTAKLIALVAEDGTPEVRTGWAPDLAAVAAPPADSRTQTGTNLVYAVQMDAGRGAIDWVSRVEGCRSRREFRASDLDATTQQLPWRAVVRRSKSLTSPAVFVACHTGTSQGAVFARVPLDEEGMAASLPVAVRTSADSETATEPPVSQTAPQRVFTGPDKTFQFLYDEGSERILARVIDAGAEVWWVFDTARWAVMGTIGIGKIQGTESTIAGLDERHGRLYVLASPATPHPGLYVTDIRRNPIPQALVFSGFDELWKYTDGSTRGASRYPLVTADGEDGIPRVFVAAGAGGSGGEYRDAPYWRVLADHVPFSMDVALDEEYAERTLDIDEREGATESAFDGTARGYGARVLLVGGAEGVARLGPADPAGLVLQLKDVYSLQDGQTANCPVGLCVGPRYSQIAPHSPCTGPNRDVVVGAVGLRQPAVVDASGGRGAADPLVIDSGTAADVQAPVSRCTGADWDEVWSKALFSRGPVAEPSVTLPAELRTAQCLSSDERPSDSTGDPVAGAYSARVSCEDESTTGYAYARGVAAGDVHVAESLSSFRIYRDPGRGIVSRVESVARGISIPGVLRIETVRGMAESWANGRRFSPPENPDGTYVPNCDYERTAGTCFRRHVFGVWTPGYQCGPCGDEQALIDGFSRGMGAYGTVRLRNPDPRLARGADNGFIAAINKPELERFPDLVLNNDLLQTVLPTLEIVRQAPPNRPLTGGGPSGRQIIQLAGVEVSSSYGITCILVYDQESGTCGAPLEPPGSIAVALTDAEGKPLAGGAFEVRRDADADGALGLKDVLLPNGACLTTDDDGVGSCKFDNVQPGTYLVSQVTAPPGYGKVSDPYVVELAGGEARTVTFTNASNLSMVQVSAADEAGKPVSGAQFAVYPDPDSDGKVAADAQPAATCTTDASGSCSMQVPAGSYVLVQTAAPGGLEPIEPVAFTFASGGQTAAVGVVNYPVGAMPAVEPAASPIDYSEATTAVVSEVVDEYQPVAGVADDPRVSLPEAVGGTIVRVIAAPGDALRLLARDPQQALAWTGSILLFAFAIVAIRRRQTAMALMGE